MPEFDWDPRTPPQVAPEIDAIQKDINSLEFDFEEVVLAIFALLEKRTIFRGCCLSILRRDLKKYDLLASASMPKKGRGAPILAFPLPLTNDDLRYTFDVYAFENPKAQLTGSESLVLRECLRLLYQAVNKGHLERDYLTGLFNRQGFTPRLKRALDAAAENNQPLAVLMLDLDKFKAVNDTYGHAAGDLVLSEFAHTIETSVEGRGIVGRWGGEEFIVALPGKDPEGAKGIAEIILKNTRALKIRVDEGGGKAIRPTTSIGIAAFPAHGNDAETLKSFADLALYEAKKGGRDRLEVYPLNAPDVQLQRLRENVSQGPTLAPAALSELESRCEIISLRERQLIPERPRAVAVAGARLYTLDGQTHRIHIYDGKAKQFVLEFGGRGEELEQLEGPVDLTVTPNGHVLIVDAPSQAVKVYNGDGKYVGFLGGRGDDGAPVPGVVKGSFNWPVAAALDPQGRVLVAESLNRRVQRFAADGRFDGLEIPLIAAEGNHDYQPDARDVAADRDGNIYILDAGNNVIRKYDPQGTPLATLGGPGTAGEPGRLKNLASLEIDRAGKLAARLAALGAPVPPGGRDVVVAAETGDVNRLQFFDAGGVFLGTVDFLRLEPKLRRLVRPGRLALSSGGSIYVIDQENADVLVIRFTEGED